jgi:hypothetical protein
MNTQKSCLEANAHAVRPHAARMAIGQNPTNPTQPLSLFCARPSRKWAFQPNYGSDTAFWRGIINLIKGKTLVKS